MKKIIIAGLMAAAFSASAQSTNVSTNVVYTVHTTYTARDLWAMNVVFTRHKANEPALTNLALTNYIQSLYENFKTNVTAVEKAAWDKKVQTAVDTSTNKAPAFKLIGLDPNDAPPD